MTVICLTPSKIQKKINEAYGGAVEITAPTHLFVGSERKTADIRKDLMGSELLFELIFYSFRIQNYSSAWNIFRKIFV